MDELDKAIENNRSYTDEPKEDQKQSWKYGNYHSVLLFYIKKELNATTHLVQIIYESYDFLLNIVYFFFIICQLFLNIHKN